jgi:hypothetical protein
MLLRQSFIDRRRHQKTGVAVDRAKMGHAAEVREREEENQPSRILSQAESAR